MVIRPEDQLDGEIELLLSYSRVEGMTADAIAMNLARHVDTVHPALDRLVSEGKIMCTGSELYHER